jgi:hypothetical protein
MVRKKILKGILKELVDWIRLTQKRSREHGAEPPV